MKKILCLIDIICFGGGAERQMTGLVQFLKQKGYIVNCVVYHPSDDLSIIKDRYGFEPTLLKVKANPLSKMIAVRNYIKKTGSYDWVIAYKGGPNLIGCLLKLWGMKFRLIVSERVSINNLSLPDVIRFFFYRFADYIIPNSYSQEKDIKIRFPNLASKTIVITNFTDTDYFSPGQKCDVRKMLRVLTVARITPQKNVATYLEAVAILKDKGITSVHFDWYGNSYCKEDQLYNDSMQRKVFEMGLTDLFSFHKATMDINKEFQCCDIFCLPSLFEGYPNVICEAMSCGKPIVCSNVCDNSIIVSEGVNGMTFDPSNPRDIADKLQQIIEKPHQELLAWGRKSREIAEIKFSREVFINKYIKLIEN